MALAIDIYYKYDAVDAQMGGDETVEAALRVKCPKIPLAVLGYGSSAVLLLQFLQHTHCVHLLPAFWHEHTWYYGPDVENFECWVQ